jgi:hypothetical protein
MIDQEQIQVEATAALNPLELLNVARHIPE